MKKVRVRYAPSPTGHLHIGGARTALFNYLFAKHYDGDFIIRIEDTDIERNIEGGERSQLHYLEWLGVIPDESPLNPNPKYAPYRQTERLDIYQKHTDLLIEQGLAYRCYCDSETLEAERELQTARGEAPMYSGRCRHLSKEEIEANQKENKPFTVRFKVEADKVYAFNDMIRQHVSFESKDIGDWVLVKANGIPTYNYAVVIDDHLMDITHVFRGEEHISNTPKQLMLFEAFNWEAPTYGHMTLIVNEQRKKLSKRDETIMQFISQYAEAGYLPEAMFNFLSLLGWSPEGEEEIFTKQEIIDMFTESRLSKSPSMFDKQKLAWINNRYIKTLSIEDTTKLCLPFLESNFDLSHRDSQWIELLISTYHDQISFGEEIVDVSRMFFDSNLELDEDSKTFLETPGVIDTIHVFRDLASKLDDWSIDNIKALINETKTVANVKGKFLFMPIRIATSLMMHGPDLPSVIVLLGKEVVINRLNQF